jgi:glucose-1-phosphate cytidylyltransferase
LHSNLGERLMRVLSLLQGEEEFLANYSDGLSDLPLDQHVDHFRRKGSIGHFLSVRPSQTFHSVVSDGDGSVTAVEPIREADLWINGGYFCFRREIFDFMRPGEELVEQPFQRLLQKRRLSTWKYDGFWSAMDTFKDKITFDRMDARDDCPWKVWRSDRRPS